MPITARLSREFYETFGDRIANEFVNWFNQVAAAYRSEFKDLFEASFSRLDARLEQRIAQFEPRVEQRLAEMRVDLERRLSEQTRWLFAAWHVVLASVIGLYRRH